VNAAASNMTTSGASAGRFGERFTVFALLVMAVVLAGVRFVLLPQRDRPEPLPFHFENPMLDARPGERVLFFPQDQPTRQSCSVVQDPGLVLRPHKGADEIGHNRGLRTGLPYLACSIHDAHRGAATCGTRTTGDVVYALNYFGMPADTQVRVDSIRPRWMKWGERELPVYEVVFQRYGALGGRWTTYLAHEAPVAGLVKWTSLLPSQTIVVYREIIEGAH